MNVEALVDRIFNHLRQLGSVVPNRRRAGVRADEVENVLLGLGLVGPNALLAVYAHCDGTTTYEGDILGRIQFFPGFHWMSLEDVVKAYEALSKGKEWKRAWLPIFANGGGDYYAVVCDGASPFFGEVVGFVRGEPDQIAEFRSIFDMLAVIERSFTDQAFFLSTNGLEADHVRMRSIARQVQPEFVEHEV